MDLQTIKRFVETVDLILNEAALQEAGRGIEVYLDTSDVRGAALGMYAYYEEGVFQSKLFDDDRALVRALAGRGDLGPIHLLGPHQAELLSLLNEGFHVHPTRIADYASRFWHDAGIVAERTSLKEMKPEQIRELVLTQAGNGKGFFKAVEAIRGEWRGRLKEWRTKGIFSITSAPHDFLSHATSQPFELLRNKLNKWRPTRTDNNFADAMALVSLMEKVDVFNQPDSKARLPCFYAAPHFRSAVKKLGLEDRLAAILPNGNRVNVLRSADYFILRAIFNNSEALGASEGVVLTADKLRSIHREMQEIVEANDALRNDQREGIEISTSDAINSLVNEVEQLSFFDNVWLPYMAEKNAQESLRRLDASDYVVQRRELQPELEQEVRNVQNILKANAERFEMLRALWSDIPRKFERQRKQLKPHAGSESDLMRHTGLLRFSLPEHSRKRIWQVVSALVSSDKLRRREATGEVVRACLGFIPTDRSTAVQAELAAATLWIAELDDHLLKLLAVPRRAHFSLDLIYAASAIRHGGHIKNALQTFDMLERLRQHSVVAREQADVALGLAYLYYHLWHRYKSNAYEQRVTREMLGLNFDEVLPTAVNRSREAYVILEKGNDEAKFVYVLNQLVYFMSIAKTPVEVVQPLAKRLRDDYQERDLWQYRYDDTLARYYHYRAMTVSDPESRKEFLKLGMERAERARAEAPGDDEIRTTYEVLKEDQISFRESTANHAVS